LTPEFETAAPEYAWLNDYCCHMFRCAHSKRCHN
jgi:hypothetical protein